ncbi:putative thioredoxin [Streptomyces sp. Tu6071]|nr:putative thioredoxin [Streptomyces sp. Tu6071]
MVLGVDLHVRDAGNEPGDLIEHAARRPAGLAEGGRELHERGPLPQPYVPQSAAREHARPVLRGPVPHGTRAHGTGFHGTRLPSTGLRRTAPGSPTLSPSPSRSRTCVAPPSLVIGPAPVLPCHFLSTRHPRPIPGASNASAPACRAWCPAFGERQGRRLDGLRGARVPGADVT